MIKIFSLKVGCKKVTSDTQRRQNMNEKSLTELTWIKPAYDWIQVQAIMETK